MKSNDIQSATDDESDDNVGDVNDDWSDSSSDSLSSDSFSKSSESDSDVSDTSINHQFFIAMLSIMDKHCLSYFSVADLLKLFSVLLPNGSSSMHMLLKRFANFEENTKLHRCCTKLLKSNVHCMVPECVTENLPVSTFIEVSLDQQLKILFSGRYEYHIWTNIQGDKLL